MIRWPWKKRRRPAFVAMTSRDGQQHLVSRGLLAQIALEELRARMAEEDS